MYTAKGLFLAFKTTMVYIQGEQLLGKVITEVHSDRVVIHLLQTYIHSYSGGKMLPFKISIHS